jgi:glucosylceramidase
MHPIRFSLLGACLFVACARADDASSELNDAGAGSTVPDPSDPPPSGPAPSGSAPSGSAGAAPVDDGAEPLGPDGAISPNPDDGTPALRPDSAVPDPARPDAAIDTEGPSVDPADAGAVALPDATSSVGVDAGNDPSDEEVPPSPRPTLVVSGEGDYWRASGWTEVPEATPTLTVDGSITHQRFDGFGGEFNEAGWDALMALAAPDRERAIELLFGEDGAHFTWGRLPVGASEYALERHTLNETPDDWEMTDFSIERDREYLLPYVHAALEVAPALRFWAVPFTPPTWMKEVAHTDGSRIRNEPEVLTAYALYLARYVEAYAEEGIEIRALHPQNEPELAADYPSCEWSAESFARFTSDHLGPTLEARGLSTEIWLGSLGLPDASDFALEVLADSNAAPWFAGIGAGWDATTLPEAVAQVFDGPIFHTLHSPGNEPWNGGLPQAPNDHDYAVQSWGLIHHWISRGVQSYSAWNMVLDSDGLGLATTLWSKNAPLVVDRNAGALIVTPAYYVFRHVSQFVEVGAVRIDLVGGEGLAFHNPDGSTVVIVHNPELDEVPVSLAIDGTVIEFAVPARGWATLNWVE